MLGTSYTKLAPTNLQKAAKMGVAGVCIRCAAPPLTCMVFKHKVAPTNLHGAANAGDAGAVQSLLK